MPQKLVFSPDLFSSLFAGRDRKQSFTFPEMVLAFFFFPFFDVRCKESSLGRHGKSAYSSDVRAAAVRAAEAVVQAAAAAAAATASCWVTRLQPISAAATQILMPLISRLI